MVKSGEKDDETRWKTIIETATVEITAELSVGLVSAGSMLGLASAVDLSMSLGGSGAFATALRELCCGRRAARPRGKPSWLAFALSSPSRSTYWST